MLISFVIVNYNTKELLKSCVDNLLEVKKTIKDIEIIVVDNVSFDGSDQLIEYEYKNRVTLIKNPKNNLPDGHNLGYKASTGDYIVHLGSDCYPKAEELKELIKYMEEHPKVGVTTGKLVTKNGSIDWDAHRGLVTPWVALTHWSGLDKFFPKSKLFGGYFLKFKDFSKPHEIDICISHFMMIKRETYEKVGLWDNTYFMYGEDMDFCLRVQNAGYKLFYIPNVEILHYKGGGVGRVTTEEEMNASRRDYNHMKKVRMETIRAMQIFYKTHMAKRYPFFINWIVYFGMFLLKIFRTIFYFIKGSAY